MTKDSTAQCRAFVRYRGSHRDRGGNRLSVSSSKMRAMASVPTAHSDEICFVYRGLRRTSRLAAGQTRQQWGLEAAALGSPSEHVTRPDGRVRWKGRVNLRLLTVQ